MLYTAKDERNYTNFLLFVDRKTYLLDGVRHYEADNQPVTNEELANIFLQSDLYER